MPETTTTTTTPKRRSTKRKPRGVTLQKTIELPSGGTLTLVGRFDVFALAPSDRGFVFALCEFFDSRGGLDLVATAAAQRAMDLGADDDARALAEHSL